MKRNKLFLLAFVSALLASSFAQAIPMSVRLYGMGENERNLTLDSFNGGNLTGWGGSFSIEPVENWSILAFIEKTRGSESDWDPTEGRFIPSEEGHPVHDGEIKAKREVRWTGLGVRWDFAEAWSAGRENLFQFYAVGALAQVRHRLTLSDTETKISDVNEDLGWTGGLGFEWAIYSASAERDKLFGLFLETGRKDHKAGYDLGAGFGTRLSHAWYWRLGVGFFFGE